MRDFLAGACAMGAWVAGLYFLRFWRATRDRLFVFFFSAFWLQALNWFVTAVIDWEVDTRPYVYLMRLGVFGLIIAGVLDKNMRARAQ